MREFLAFILPPAVALAGMRLSQWILGEEFAAAFGGGFRFAFGLGTGMLLFSQALFLCALAGFDVSFPLAWLALTWGAVEIFLWATKFPAVLKAIRIQSSHGWLLLLLPLVCLWYVFGRVSTMEGTLEFDANVFWVFKAKIFYFEQGRDLIQIFRNSNLGYMHMNYPMLVPCLYTLDYGLVWGVDEFVNKVWPFWMMVAFSLAIFSFADVWRRPHPFPILIATIIGFLPASMLYMRNEGGTIPMVFYTGLATLLMVSAVQGKKDISFAALVLVLAGGFSAKFEGGMFAVVCAGVLLPFCLRRGWLKNRAFWKSAGVAALSLLPYVFLRCLKPVSHPQDAWVHMGLTEPGNALHRFPQSWFLGVVGPFFNTDFFRWKAVGEHLQWAGQWQDLATFVNVQLSVLPWLLMVLLLFSIVCKSRERMVIGVLSVIFLGVFTALALIIACLYVNDLASAIDIAATVTCRYYYPFFVAWFLGIAALWFPNDTPPPQQKIDHADGVPN